MPNLETILAEQFNALKMSLKNNPLNLGGFTASGGGLGGPPGGYIGMLPQTRVAYDATEESTALNFIPSGASLLDNLNHIRYRINMISGYGAPDLMILQSGVTVVSGFKYLNFEGDATLEPFPDGVTITMTSVPGPKGDDGVAGIGVTDISVSLSGVPIASGIKNINFEGNVTISGIPDGVTVTISGGGGSGTVTLPIYEDVGIFTIPSGTFHVLSNHTDKPVEIIEGKSGNLSPLWLSIDDDTYQLRYATTDLSTWTNAEGTLPGSIDNYIQGISTSGTLWLLPTGIDGYLYYSYDGIHWLKQDTEVFPGGYVYVTTWNGTMWVAGGNYYDSNTSEYHSLAYSYDGFTWEINPTQYLDNYCTDVIWNGNMWMAGGDYYNDVTESILVYSYNGIDWFETNSVGMLAPVLTICYGNGVWVAGGKSGNTADTLIYSTDGINWNIANGIINDRVYDIAYNGSKFIAVGLSQVKSTPDAGIPSIISTDGINWNALTIFRLEDRIGYSNRCYSVAWNGTYWLVGGKDKDTYSDMKMNAYSSDGVTWSFVYDNSVVNNEWLYFTEVYGYPSPEIYPPMPEAQTANLTEWHTGTDTVASVSPQGAGTFTSLNIENNGSVAVGLSHTFHVLDSGGSIVHELVFSGGLLVGYT